MAPELLVRADNARPLEEERRIQRGRILSADGQELAVSRRESSGLSTRTYTYNPLAATVGYWSPTRGAGGLELARDLDLRGQGRLTSLDALTRRLLHYPVIGDDVVLTIDLRLQKLADEALGSRNGAIVLLNANTGAILAMASHPYIDPNRLDADWSKISTDPNRPLINRATQGLYTPGSTFKTVTLAAALETGRVSPTSVFSYTLRPPDGQHTLWWHTGPNGITCANHPDNKMPLDLAGIYSWSCNVAFAEIGLDLGRRCTPTMPGASAWSRWCRWSCRWRPAGSSTPPTTCWAPSASTPWPAPPSARASWPSRHCRWPSSPPP